MSRHYSPEHGISSYTMFRVFMNSFFIQSAWSFEKMQGLGFAAAIAPAVREIYGDRAQACAALKRHMVFYNAHPYMASPILGAVIRMEEDIKSGRRAASDAAFFKESLIGPYGAIGDGFFWSAVRPFASLLGVLTALIWGIWGPVIFLVTYNIFHIWMRWSGLRKGYELGEDVVEYIKALELPEQSLRMKLVCAGLLGITTVAAVIYVFPEIRDGYQLFLGGLAAVSVSMILSQILRNWISAVSAVYLLFLPALILMLVSAAL